MRLCAALASTLLLIGCGQGQRPFRIVQFCLNGEQDIARLKDVTRSIAVSHGLEFTDRSADAEAEGESIKKSMPNTTVAHPTIVLSGHRNDGLGFGGGNFPEAALQVTFGFSKGNNEAQARKFATEVVRTLSRSWVIHEVPHPEAQGAFPLKRCDYVTPTA